MTDKSNDQATPGGATSRTRTAAAKKTATRTTTKKAATKKRAARPAAKKSATEPAAKSTARSAPKKAVAAGNGHSPAKLRGVSAIRAFFRRNQTPIYFVSPTPFNLLGVDRWISNFHYINYYDSFEGQHPRAFVVPNGDAPEFTSMEDMNNYLISHPAFADLVARNGGGGRAIMVMFDEHTEELARHAGLQIALPPAALRHRMDSKLVTTRMGNEAGVPSVPNVLGTVESYDGLLSLAASAGLGDDLVVQLPWGDSGKTTFFIKDRAGWDDAEKDNTLTGVEMKVMKRINCRPVAVEAVLTRHGTLVGPIMADITGFTELTPYPGGWAGNDVHLDVLTEDQRNRARVLTEHLGDRLGSEGYRGFFEVDFLVDTESGELYLGELNPRLSGCSSMTNVTAGAYAELPLFLFHLLEYLDVDYDIDVAEINSRWADPSSIDVWSQVVIKQTKDEVGLITESPRTGIYRIGSRGAVEFLRPDTDWHDLASDDEGFYLRIAGPGDYGYKGADIGIVVSRGRLQTDDFELTPLCRRWVEGVRKAVEATPLNQLRAPVAVGAKG